MAYTLLRELEGICKRFTGHVSAAEFVRSIVETQSILDFDRLRYTINDFSAVDSFDIGEQTLLEIAAFGLGSRAFNARVRMAVVCRDPAIAALVDQFLTMAQVPLRRFETLDDARAWLATDTAA